MLTEEAVELLEGGSALVVGLVGPDGTPLATRAWGMRVHPGGGTARVLVTARDIASVRVAERPGSDFTVTGACVATLRSVQVKGSIVAVTPTGEADSECMDDYCSRLVNDVSTVDGIPRYLVERLLPDEVVACEIELREVYDQTPGPGAGAQLTGGAAL